MVSNEEIFSGATTAKLLGKVLESNKSFQPNQPNTRSTYVQRKRVQKSWSQVMDAIIIIKYVCFSLTHLHMK